MSRRTAAERRRRSRVVDNEFAQVILSRTQRSVRITVVTHAAALTGRATKATFAFADLDDASLQRLAKRALALRGGKRALP